MPSRPGFAVCLLCLFWLTGCSVFGVATRTDLENMTLRQEAERAALENEIEDLDRQLASMNGLLDDIQTQLEPRLANLEGGLENLGQGAALEIVQTVTRRSGWDQ